MPHLISAMVLSVTTLLREHWSWKYEPLAPVTKTITTVEDIEEPIVFENKLKKYFDGGEEDTGSTKVHDETSKENRMIQ